MDALGFPRRTVLEGTIHCSDHLSHQPQLQNASTNYGVVSSCSCVKKNNEISSEKLFEVQIEISITQKDASKMYPAVPLRLGDIILARSRKIPVMIQYSYLELFYCPHWFALQSISDYKINQFAIMGSLQLSVPLQLPPSDSNHHHSSTWLTEVVPL